MSAPASSSSTATVTTAIIACLDGMSDDYKLMSRRKIQEWFKPFWNDKMPELADLSKCILYQDLLVALFPATRPLLKGRKENSRGAFDNRHNWLILQKMLARIGVKKHVDPDQLAKSNSIPNWEFTRWFIYFYDVNSGRANHEPPTVPSTTAGYSTPRTRRLSVLPNSARPSQVTSSRLTLTMTASRRFSVASTISLPGTPKRTAVPPARPTPLTTPAVTASPASLVMPSSKKESVSIGTQTARDMSTQTDPTTPSPPRRVAIPQLDQVAEEDDDEYPDNREARRMPRDSIEIPCVGGEPKKYKYSTRL